MAERHDLGASTLVVLVHRGSDCPSDAVGSGPSGIVGHVGVTRSRLGIAVPQQLADDWKPHTGADPSSGERVPKIVQPHVIEAGPFPNTFPHLRQTNEMAALDCPGEDIGIILQTRMRGQ